MRLVKLVLKNFRGFESFELDFQPEVTVIAGVNGSGKTTILDAINRMLFHMTASGAVSINFDMDTRNGATEGGVFLEGIILGQSCSASKTLSNNTWGITKVDSVKLPDEQRSNGPLPIWPYYKVNRHADDSTPGLTNPKYWRADQAWDPRTGNTGFSELFKWYREKEDTENETIRDDPSFLDPHLQAVRAALEKLLEVYTSPRIRRIWQNRGKPVLTLTKEGQELAFDQLSEGERTTAALVCDIARRLAIANSTGDPLLGEGVVLIDEIDLHLHPAWQVRIIPALRQTFPNLQWVVTTHSPLVLSYVPGECVRLIKDFKLVACTPKTEGRDPNTVLTDLFEVPLRPAAVEQKLRQIADFIDDDQIEQARQSLDALQQQLGGDDREIVRLNAILDLMED